MGIDAEALRTAVAESKPEAAEGTEEAWVVWRYRLESRLETNALVITPASPSGTACARYAAAPDDDVYFETAAALLAVC